MYYVFLLSFSFKELFELFNWYISFVVFRICSSLTQEKNELFVLLLIFILTQTE